MARVLLLPITNKVNKSLVRIVCNVIFFSYALMIFSLKFVNMRIFLWVIKWRLQWIFPAYDLYLTQCAANEMFNFHSISNIQHVTNQHPQYKQGKEKREKNIRLVSCQSCNRNAKALKRVYRDGRQMLQCYSEVWWLMYYLFYGW